MSGHWYKAVIDKFGTVKNIVGDFEIEVYFDSIGDGLTQWVHYPTWER